MYRLLHPDLGIALAHSLSHMSRNAGDPEKKYTDNDYREFAWSKIKQGYDMVVMGHTHIAANEKKYGGWYLNPGNWMQDFSFSVIDDNGPALYQWQGNRAVPLNV